MEFTASVNGQGNLTAAQLRTLLDDIPDDAVLKIRTDSDQRDGAFWSFEAKWMPGGVERARSTFERTGRSLGIGASMRRSDDQYQGPYGFGAGGGQFGDH